MEETKLHHRVDVIRINKVKVHPNADRLEIIPIEGYQAVVGKGQFKAGDLAYYIPPDSVVPNRPEYDFLWKGPVEGDVPLRKRRITAKRLRGEWSEGLLMPVERDPELGNVPCVTTRVRDEVCWHRVEEGDDVAKILDIIHYDPPDEENPSSGSRTEGVRKGKIPTTWRGWVNFIKMWIRGERREGGPGLPVYDVEALKKHMHVFIPGESVIVTEKIHGSNARYSYIKNLFGYGHMYAGSRQLWKSLDSTCAWRRALKDNPWMEPWCKAHPGYALYGEIIPTQKNYNYGTEDGRIRFFLFDVRDPKGRWMNYYDVVALFGEAYMVPLLYVGPFDLDTIKTFVDGPSTVPGAKTQREGVVIKTEPNREAHNLGRVQLKIVSNEFLEKDSK
jgi:hypothetical protein